MEQIDSRIVELMASRLCHELVGPIGAVANGLELVEETEGSIAAEAMAMVGDSAKELASRIKFYRIAYGVVGSDFNSLAELRGLSTAFFNEGDVRLNWPMPPIAPRLGEGEGKLVLNMIAIAKSAISRSGEVQVNIEGEDLLVTAKGNGVALADDLIRALSKDCEIDAMTPRNVQGFWAYLLSKRVGRSLCYEVKGPDEIELRA